MEELTQNNFGHTLQNLTLKSAALMQMSRFEEADEALLEALNKVLSKLFVFYFIGC